MIDINAAVCWLLLFIAVGLRADEHKIEVQTLTGTTLSYLGRLNWSATGELLIRRDDHKLTPLPWTDLVQARVLGRPLVVRPTAACVWLATGELFVGDVRTLDDEKVTLHNDLMGRVEAPLAVVRAVLTEPRPDAGLWRMVEQLSADVGAGGDRILLRNRDVLTGVLAGIEGSIIRLQQGEKTTSLSKDRVAGIVLDGSLLEPPDATKPRLELRLLDGSIVQTRELKQPMRTLLAQSIHGIELPIDPEDVTYVGQLSPSIAYVHELEPLATTTAAFLDLKPTVTRQQSALQTPLTIAGAAYARGMCMTSRSTITYAVAGFDRFETVLGLDDQAGPAGNVDVSILLDDKPVWRRDSLEPAAGAVPIQLELKGAERLTLSVDFGKRGDLGDFVDWADARLIRKP